MYALLIALIVVLYAMVKAKETFVLKVGDPRKDQDIIVMEQQKPGYRLFATTPDSCPTGYENNGGLCYPMCEPGYEGQGPLCRANTTDVGIGRPVGLEPCPAGWSNDGLICREPLRWNSCKWRGLFKECWGGLEGGRLRGRLNDGGICDYPQDRTKLPSWLVEPVPNAEAIRNKARAINKNSGNAKVELLRATHPDKVVGLCYKPCPENRPNRVIGLPTYCMKGDPRRYLYGRGVGKIPPILVFGND